MTKYLLDNRLAPLTFSVGFIEKPLSEVADFVTRWHKGDFATPEVRQTLPLVSREPLHASLEEALRNLDPLVVPRIDLLLSTDSAWTALFGNSRRGAGGGAFGESYICKEMACRGIAVDCRPNTLVNEKKGTKGIYGSVQFVLLGPEQREFLNYERGIAAVNDGGRWVFNAGGTPLPFEQISRYSARRVVDRFTPEMLEQYCAEFGIRLFDPAFYGPDGVLIKMSRRPGAPRGSTKSRPITLREAQDEMGPLPS